MDYDRRQLRDATKEQLVGNYKAATKIYLKLARSKNRLVADRAIANAAILGYQVMTLQPTPEKRLEALNSSIHLMRTVIHRRPGIADLHFNLGTMLYERGDDEAAQQALRYAIALKPEFPAALGNLGACLLNIGKFDQALDVYERAIAIEDRASPEAVWNRALTLLLFGRYAEGWKDYEIRWQMALWRADNDRPDLTAPFWDGSPLPGKTLLVFAEQGFGDALMMFRFWPQLAAQADRILWEAPPALVELFRLNLPPAHVVFARGETPPPHDVRVPLMSLPYRCGVTSMESVPPAPYLRLTPWTPDHHDGRIRVGFAWRGSSGHRNDRRRSTQLLDWLPLLQMPEIQWVCLAVDTTPEEEALLATLPDLERLPPTPSFQVTGEVMAGLDLVITVDTAMAHLSGALGIPVWILLAAAPDYRWGLGLVTTPWYGTAQLFRQSNHRSWEDVFVAVHLALQEGLGLAEAA